ncbi:hypothetical protein CVT24_007638 [Panaeolus cyanescens]|uniref:Uncharacterized protein n=1 Tax=Panaeolus cyanescens TaxID=181874 RepID=A0A409WYZ0_9AGAR|nr:hypothetical protein CVT24_007638 [Panaeolus cyanescens]
MRLPQDILDYMIDQFGRSTATPRDLIEDYHAIWTPLVQSNNPKNLVSDSLATLKSLCLVSHDCRRRAVRILFHSIDIAGKNHRILHLRAQRLYDILSTPSLSGGQSLQPPVAECIRTVTLRRAPMDFFASDLTEHCPVKYMFKEGSSVTKIFQELLKPCVTITGLRIDFGMARIAIGWDQFPAVFRSSVEALIRSPNLQVLSLCNVLNLHHGIFDQSSIKALQLITYKSDTDTVEVSNFDASEGVVFEPPNVEYLLVNDRLSVDFLDTPAWQSVLENLKGFNIDSLFDIDTYSRVLHLAQNSLEILRVDRINCGKVVDHMESSSFNAFNFGQYSTLQNLSITRYRYPSLSFNKQVPDEDIMQLIRILQATDTCTELCSFALQILDFYEEEADEEFLVPDPPTGQLSVWEELDIVITSSRFPALQHFNLVVSAEIKRHPSGEFDSEKMIKATTECFERSFAKTRALQRVELEWEIDIYVHQLHAH